MSMRCFFDANRNVVGKKTFTFNIKLITSQYRIVFQKGKSRGWGVQDPNVTGSTVYRGLLISQAFEIERIAGMDGIEWVLAKVEPK